MARRRPNAGGSKATTLEAHTARFHSAKAATTVDGANEPMMLVSLVRKQGIIEHLAFTQGDSIRLIGALAHGLADQDLLLGHAVLRVTARSQTDPKTPERPVQVAAPIAGKRTLLVRRPRANGLSDKLISGAAELFAVHQRAAQAGPSDALQQMFDVEPDLARYIDRTLGWIFKRLGHVKNPTNVVSTVENDVVLLVATVFTATREAHYELWCDTMVGTRLAQIDPKLEVGRRRRKFRAEGRGKDNGS